jgi:hypothetical protein
MTVPIDLQARVNAALDKLFEVGNDLAELRDHGLDDARARRVDGFAEILNATWSTMLDFFADFPDLKPVDLMTEEEENAYHRGHGRILMFPKPHSDG